MCCPKGWRRFQGSCYFLSTDMMSWDDSAEICTGMGSQLVVITSSAEQVSAQGPRERDPAGRATVLGPGGDSEPSLSCRGGGRSCLSLCSTSPLCHQPHIMVISDASVCSVLPLMDIALSQACLCPRFWPRGEPSEGYDENCVIIYRDTELPNNWNSVRCLNYHRICEAAAVIV
nr:CD209 antigen [Zonotrichia albicollis]